MKDNDPASRLPHILWPPLERDPGGQVAMPLKKIIETERLPAAERQERQYAQLRALAAFAQENAPFYRDAFQAAGMDASGLTGPEALACLPVLSRRDLQQKYAAIDSRGAIPAHGPFGRVQTSGSSGEPVLMHRSAAAHAFWLAYTMREHLWHRRDFTKSMAVIRAMPGTETRRDLPNWGPPATLVTNTGPAHALPIDTDIAQLCAWLNEIRPAYLLVYPSTLAALLDQAQAGRLAHGGLQQIRSIGETMPSALRARVEGSWGISVADLYSSQELGVIAAQCPHGSYHVSESLIVEILDESGHPVAPGQTGRVVATDLHNFATPLLRYDIGDYAVQGPDGCCPCGRGLARLSAIRGRERNLIRHPDGSRHWPLVGFHRYREIADIRQYQIIQTAPNRLELRIVAGTTLTPAQEDALRGVVTGSLGHPFHIDIAYFENVIPRAAGGKFEEFISLV